MNFAIESLGDKWSLVLMRDMIFWGKKTYGEFLKSDEGIATNILADRLVYLGSEGLIYKSPDPLDKRKDIYRPTEKGLALVPMFLEMIAWSSNDIVWQSMPHESATAEQQRLVERAVTEKNKTKLVEEIKSAVRRDSCVFETVIRSARSE